jgi:hypothetical protein
MQGAIRAMDHADMLTLTHFLQLFAVTADNTSNNDTLCQTVEELAATRLLADWLAAEARLP